MASEQQLGSRIEDTYDIDPLVPIETTSQSTPQNNLCELKKLYIDIKSIFICILYTNIKLTADNMNTLYIQYSDFVNVS